MSHVVRETREDTGSQFCNVFTSILKSGSDSVTIAKVLEDNLLSESEFADSKQELDIAEGDAYKSIKEVRVATISGTSFDAISRAVSRSMSRGIPRAIFGVVFEAILKVKTKVKSREIEEGNQQFRAEWEKYNQV